MRREQRDLRGLDVDAVGAEQLGAEEAIEGRDRAVPRRGDEKVDELEERAGALGEPGVLGGTLGQVGANGHAEGETPLVHPRGACVRGMRRHAEADELGLRERSAERLVSARHGAGVAAEDLEVDDRAETELLGRRRCRARVAVVRGRRDACGEGVRGAAAGDRERLAGAEPSLARDVRAQPVREWCSVAEAAVDRVLQVGVCVDDSGQDERAVVVLGRPTGGDLDDAVALPGDGSLPERRAVDRQHPVGGHGRGSCLEGGLEAGAPPIEQDRQPDRRLIEDE